MKTRVKAKASLYSTCKEANFKPRANPCGMFEFMFCQRPLTSNKVIVKYTTISYLKLLLNV